MAQPSKPLKSGDFAVSVAEDPVLWTDRKRVLGLPLSFTRYSLQQAGAEHRLHEPA